MNDKIGKTRKTKIIRLIHRQEQWTLTLQGWVLSLACIATLGIFMITQIHPFLAVNYPVKANIMVVEGWLPDYAFKQAIAEFESGYYSQLITTGLPLPIGFYLAEYKTFAELSAATLIALGFEKEKLVAVPAPNAVKHRTYAAAVALRQWLSKSNLKVESLNLYSYDVHARRSWLVFKQVLAPKIRVGVIAAQSLDYEPKKWWLSSEGVRSVISETIAYIYARFIDWRD